MRLLSLTLSATVYAVTTVLCSFIAGLALGAALAGRLGVRVQRPLLAYGVIEIAIALVALATPPILWRLGPIDVSLHGPLGASGVSIGVARFLLVFAVLLLPCTLMGATLPLLSWAVIEREEDAALGGRSAVRDQHARGRCRLSGGGLRVDTGAGAAGHESGRRADQPRGRACGRGARPPGGSDTRCADARAGSCAA